MTLLHEYGLVTTYNEVMKFRTSAAIHTGKQPYTFGGLSENDGVLMSWVDNYDLNVFTPNGCRETHSLVVELTQQPESGPADEEMSTSNSEEDIVIPRLSQLEISQVKLSDLSPVTMRHYQAGKNHKLPATVDHDGLPYKDAVKQLADIKKALEADTEWLAKIITCEDPGDPPPEWSGYMNHLAREGGFISKATQSVYGPLIDVPPSHPDTVLTSITYIEEFMQSYGRTYIHLVADLQLYKVAIQLKWSDPMRWKHLIVRPRGMHTLMSFLDCIENLMKGTGLEELLGVAYKGVSSMLNGKAWPKAVKRLAYGCH